MRGDLIFFFFLKLLVVSIIIVSIHFNNNYNNEKGFDSGMFGNLVPCLIIYM